MKCFIENFMELDIDELLAVNGGYGNSSGSYGTTSSSGSGNQSSWDVWVANKDGRNSSGEITQPYDPYKNAPINSGNYKETSFVPDISGGEKTPFYMQQREFSSLYGNEFGNTACAATSLLNEISERYTLETGLVMTEEQAVSAMNAAVKNKKIGENEVAINGTSKFYATVNDWSAAANAMWATTGLSGSFVVNESLNADHVIYALDTKGDSGADHFVNSNGDSTFYDPYTGETLNIADYKLQEGRNYRGVDFVK